MVAQFLHLSLAASTIGMIFSAAALLLSASSLPSIHSWNASLYSAGQVSLAIASFIAASIRARSFLSAKVIPKPNSQKSSNNELAQAGP